MDSYTATQYTNHVIRSMFQNYKPLTQAQFERLVARIQHK